jgi:methyl-accepting chemotaxis protein
MDWKNRITSIAVGFLVVSQLLILSLTVYSIKTRGDEELRSFRTEETERIKLNLQGHVDNVYSLIEDQYIRATDKRHLERYYGHRLKNIIDAAESLLRSKAAKVRSGELSLGKAKQEARAEIKRLRYDDGTGYVWINDMRQPYPVMIMHPTVPELDGKTLSDPKFNCALGRGQNLFQAFADVCRTDGEGFVDYLWPKPGPDGLIPDIPKLSYVRLFREWGWVIGTGIYIDDAVEDAVESAKASIKKIRYDNGTGYFWINDTTRPVPKMIMHPVIPELDGTVLDAPKFNSAQGVGKNLFVAFADVCEKDGTGFVDYLWPKPTKDGLKDDVPKLSYVKLFKPLGWIVGTGVYIDSIDDAVAKKAGEINRQMLSLILKASLLSAFITVAAVCGLKRALAKHESGGGPGPAGPAVPPGPEAKAAGDAPSGAPNQSREIVAAAKELCRFVYAEQAKLSAFNEAMSASRQPRAGGPPDVAEGVLAHARHVEETLSDIKASSDISVQTLERINEAIGDLKKDIEENFGPEVRQR